MVERPKQNGERKATLDSLNNKARKDKQVSQLIPGTKVQKNQCNN